MQKKMYTLKWAIAYKNKAYVEVYGKKKAHDLMYNLSFCVLGLSVEPVEPVKKEPNEKRQKINEYYRKWRERNREKVQQYQENYRRKNNEIIKKN